MTGKLRKSWLRNVTQHCRHGQARAETSSLGHGGNWRSLGACGSALRPEWTPGSHSPSFLWGRWATQHAVHRTALSGSCRHSIDTVTFYLGQEFSSFLSAISSIFLYAASERFGIPAAHLDPNLSVMHHVHMCHWEKKVPMSEEGCVSRVHRGQPTARRPSRTVWFHTGAIPSTSQRGVVWFSVCFLKTRSLVLVRSCPGTTNAD